MGGPNSFFRNPFGFSNRSYEDDSGITEEEHGARSRMPSLLKSFVEDGSLSKATANEVMGKLTQIGSAGVMDIVGQEREGKSAGGRSRVATQKMFETMQARPGQRQTLLTPRSNASRGMLGV